MYKCKYFKASLFQKLRFFVLVFFNMRLREVFLNIEAVQLGIESAVGDQILFFFTILQTNLFDSMKLKNFLCIHLKVQTSYFFNKCYPVDHASLPITLKTGYVHKLHFLLKLTNNISKICYKKNLATSHK